MIHAPSATDFSHDQPACTGILLANLGSPDARPFNAGKQEEVKRRVKHLGSATGQMGEE